MLKNLLKEIDTARVFSKSEIGQKLDISEVMVEELVDQLSRMGYIEEDMGSPLCESKCSGCFISSCNVTPIKTLSITDKGHRLLKD